jgi:hypothetical protein
MLNNPAYRIETRKQHATLDQAMAINLTLHGTFFIGLPVELAACKNWNDLAYQRQFEELPDEVQQDIALGAPQLIPNYKHSKIQTDKYDDEDIPSKDGVRLLCGDCMSLIPRAARCGCESQERRRCDDTCGRIPLAFR